MKKGLKSGYTTGACAAAAAKAAALLLFSAEVKEVEIPFPDGSRVSFKINNSKLLTLNSELIAQASVIKDAGDDPDVTHGAEIKAKVSIRSKCEGEMQIIIRGGKGVGMVTKPGLSIPVGEPAINPVPRRMITAAVLEAMNQQSAVSGQRVLEITISVTDGEELAKKTLNSRLGILGGISILGTTGIVKPVSTEAWTATITSSMDVAIAAGIKEIVLSAGRTSEKAHMKKYNLPEESYVLMGDYLEYSLQEAKKHGFKKVSLCAQWAKMLKIAMATPQTHVRFGAIDIKKAVRFLHAAGINIPDREYNTAQEIFDYVNPELFQKICDAARKYAEDVAMIPVSAKLVSYTGEIIAENE